MKKYKIKLTHSITEAIVSTLQPFFAEDFFAIEDKLVLACLHEVYIIMQTRLPTCKEAYSFTFTAAHAIAISIFYTNFIINPTTQIGNKLHQMHQQIHQLYF